MDAAVVHPRRGLLRRRRPKRRSLLWRLRRPLFLLGLVVVAGIAGIGWVLTRVPLPPVDPPLETTFIYDAEGNELAELSGGENRVLVDIEAVPEVLIGAVVAAEDRDFFNHPGVDGSAIARATIADLRGQPLQGGSTITQQYVKNVFVGDDRTIERKLKEATLAIKLEREFTKDEILERYLNTVYFGRGAYGVQAASRAYFAHDVVDIDIGEAAYLAGLLRAPEQADANDPAEPAGAVEADRRQGLVLRAMAEERYITTDESRFVAAVEVQAAVRPRDEVVRDRVSGGEVGTQYFLEHVRRQLVEEYGPERVNGGGLRVTTTLQPDLQRAAYDAVYNETLDRDSDPAGALVSLDGNGRVVAMVGGKDWNGETNFARINLAVGTEGGGLGRQPGSAFKPFVLAEAMRQGYSLESAFESRAEWTFEGAGDGGVDYVMENYNGSSHGRVNLVKATQVSSNTVYGQLTEALGPPAVVDMAHGLGIRSEMEPRVGIALGTPDVSVLDMADAYLTLARRGSRVDPVVVTKVTDADGDVLLDRGAVPESEQVLEPAQADRVNYVLQSVVESGTGTRARLRTPIAGKTGTTQGYGDAWFVGYTPGMSTAVWMGYPNDRTPMENVHGEDITGGTLPAEIFKRYMTVAVEDPSYAGEFPDPADLGGRVFSGGRVPVVDADADARVDRRDEGGTDEVDGDEGGGDEGDGDEGPPDRGGDETPTTTAPRSAPSTAAERGAEGGAGGTTTTVVAPPPPTTSPPTSAPPPPTSPPTAVPTTTAPEPGSG